MTGPLISIIVPIYNVEKYLSKCVDSLRNQTLKDIEIILIDDESPDNCPRLCDEYANEDRRIKVVHKKNGGLGFARNSGLEVATGQYVAFIDSDDYIELNAYETLYNKAKENDLDLLCFSYNRFAENDFRTEEKYNAELEVCADKEQIRTSALGVFDHAGLKVRPIGGSSCMALFKREIIEVNHLRFVSERQYISEDFIFVFLFSIHSSKVGWLDNTYYHYRLNLNSLTNVVRLDRMEKSEAYAKYVSDLIVQNGYSESCRRFAWGYYIGNARSATVSVFMSNMKMEEKKKWFYQQMSSTYFQKVKHLYPLHVLPLKQRICLYTMGRKMFWPTYMIIVGFSKIRNNPHR